MRMQDDEREQQRQRDGQGDNDGGAEADQEEDQNDQHEHHAAKQVVLHRVGGQVHQVAAIVIRTNLYVRGKDVAIQLLSLGLDALEHILRLLAT